MATGDIGAAVLDSWVAFAGDVVDAKLLKWNGNVFVLAYRDNSDGAPITLKLVTFRVAEDGTITESFIDTATVISGDNVTDLAQIIKISSTVLAILYSDSGADGRVVTVSIDGSGNIGAVIDNLEYDATSGVWGSITHVSGDVYAVAYTGSGNDGFVATFTIDSSGNIGAAVIDSWEFDGTNGLYPFILNISGTVFAIAYGGPSGSLGTVFTLNIAADGSITKSAVDSLTFETTTISHNHTLLHVTDDTYLVTYNIANATAPGYAKTMTIDSLGNIGAAVVSTLDLSADGRAQNPSTIEVGSGEGVFLIIFIADNVISGGVEKPAARSILSTAGVLSLVDTLYPLSSDASSVYPSVVYLTSNTYVLCFISGGVTALTIATLSVETPTGWPTNSITRVTNLIHRYSRDEGIYTLEMNLGEVTSDFGIPEWVTNPPMLPAGMKSASPPPMFVPPPPAPPVPKTVIAMPDLDFTQDTKQPTIGERVVEAAVAGTGIFGFVQFFRNLFGGRK